MHLEKGCSYLCTWTTSKLAGKKQNIDPMCKALNEDDNLGEPTSSRDHVYTWVALNDNAKFKDIVDNCRTMFESRISAVRTAKLPFSENLFCVQGHAKNVWNDIVNQQTRCLNNSVKYFLHASIFI